MLRTFFIHIIYLIDLYDSQDMCGTRLWFDNVLC